MTITQKDLGEAQAAVRFLKDILEDLRFQAQQTVIDDPSLKNEGARAAKLAAILRVDEAYQATKSQLDTALRAERMAKAAHDDAERQLAAWGKQLQALGYQAQEEAARLALEGYTRFAEGAARVLQAREGVARA